MTVVFLTGIVAGTANSVVGSGTLVTFPTLLAIRIPPVVANASNSLGLVPGSVVGAWGYRREMTVPCGRMIRLAAGSCLGAALGAILLLDLPKDTFGAIVPVLIAIGLILVILQPWLTRRIRRRRGTDSAKAAIGGAAGAVPGEVLLWFLVFATGVYGGYFGAAQGVILLAILGIALEEGLQGTNALKNILVAVANGVGGVVFLAAAHVDWAAILLVGAGAGIGGKVGATYGRRLPPPAMRAIIVAVGVAALVNAMRLRRIMGNTWGCYDIWT